MPRPGPEEELSEAIQGLLDLPMPSLEDFLVSTDKRDLLAQDMARLVRQAPSASRSAPL